MQSGVKRGDKLSKYCAYVSPNIFFAIIIPGQVPVMAAIKKNTGIA